MDLGISVNGNAEPHRMQRLPHRHYSLSVCQRHGVAFEIGEPCLDVEFTIVPVIATALDLPMVKFLAGVGWLLEHQERPSESGGNQRRAEVIHSAPLMNQD